MLRLHATLFLLLVLTRPAVAAPAEDAAFFEKQVRPVLIDRCLGCHGPDKQKGGLRLDSRAAVLSGGDRGPAVVVGKPAESLLVSALSHGDAVKMPPKNKLPEAEIAALTEWVRRGVPWPDAAPTTTTTKAGERAFTAEEKAFWAFQRPAPPEIPSTKSHITNNPIDAFILARLRDKGLTPSPEADRRTLLRRLSFDLTGLPPTPDEVERARSDESVDWYEKVVERLLASPAYGEKWGRRWLDVARYADSNGMDENLAYVNAWRYRDYVVRSFNADKPYDRFVTEQLAGDLLPGDDPDRLVATGFLVVGPKMLAEDDPVKMRMDVIDEQLDTVGQAVLGLTLGCARCHDHKFDPVTTGDYYGLAGLFYSTKTMRNFSVVAQWHERPIAEPAPAEVAAYERRVEAAREAVAAAEPATPLLPAEVERLRGQLAAVTKDRPVGPLAMAVEDDKGQDLRVHLRGNHTTLGAVAPRRLPRILAGDAVLSLDEKRSGRLELARWVSDPANPLTARVMANRIWAGHFGRGLVATPDNFGRLGDRPTHPELLDWLAAEFVRSGWSVKGLHRRIVTSATYRQATPASDRAKGVDPDNRLLSHFSRRRLDAEEVRDGLLAVSGLLDRTMGGSLLQATPRQYVTSTANKNYDGYAVPRRSVYLPVIRSAVFDVLQTLDFPDPSVPLGQRTATTIPTQALLMLNSPLADRAAEALAKAVAATPGTDADRVGEAYRRVYGRTPTTAETERVLAFLKAADGPQAWRGLCRVLLASNEFVFVE